MKRHPTIATVWLLPAMLFWIETIANTGRIWEDAMAFIQVVGLIASLSAIAGAFFAVRTKPTLLGMSRRQIVAGIFILATIGACGIASTQDTLASAKSLTILAFLMLTLFLASMPLWGTVLFWRPGARLTSRSFAGVVLACTLPFACLVALDVTTGHNAVQPIIGGLFDPTRRVAAEGRASESTNAFNQGFCIT